MDRQNRQNLPIPQWEDFTFLANEISVVGDAAAAAAEGCERLHVLMSIPLRTITSDPFRASRDRPAAVADSSPSERLNKIAGEIGVIAELEDADSKEERISVEKSEGFIKFDLKFPCGNMYDVILTQHYCYYKLIEIHSRAILMDESVRHEQHVYFEHDDVSQLLHFKCPCGDKYELWIVGSHCYYKLTSF